MSYCDSLISQAIAQNCDQIHQSGLENVGVIINRDDIDFDSCTLEDNVISVLALKSGKKGYKITQPAKNPFTGTQTSLATGTYYNSWTHNVAFVILDDAPDVSANIVDGLANGSFVVILENKTKGTGGEFQIYGWHQGLTASEITEDKYSEDTDGGWAVTMAEEKAPLSALYFNVGTYAGTKTAFDSLTTSAS